MVFSGSMVTAYSMIGSPPSSVVVHDSSILQS
jgi:hypothetical protein